MCSRGASRSRWGDLLPGKAEPWRALGILPAGLWSTAGKARLLSGKEPSVRTRWLGPKASSARGSGVGQRLTRPPSAPHLSELCIRPALLQSNLQSSALLKQPTVTPRPCSGTVLSLVLPWPSLRRGSGSALLPPAAAWHQIGSIPPPAPEQSLRIFKGAFLTAWVEIPAVQLSWAELPSSKDDS